MGTETLGSLSQACGGTIVDKLPQDGYVLVDQCTKPGTHFIRAYSNPALDRRIVSMRFVEESMARRELVPYPALILFIKAGVPVLFHLHESLEEAEQEVLSSSISVRVPILYLCITNTNHSTRCYS